MGIFVIRVKFDTSVRQLLFDSGKRKTSDVRISFQPFHLKYNFASGTTKYGQTALSLVWTNGFHYFVPNALLKRISLAIGLLRSMRALGLFVAQSR